VATRAAAAAGWHEIRRHHRLVSAEPGGAAVWLVVELQSSEEQVSRIVTLLSQLEIPAEVVEPGAPADDPGHIALRVPADGVVAAVLALEQHGFTRVKAYGSEGR
jgi:type III secretory pathway lipoprotein EscJ